MQKSNSSPSTTGFLDAGVWQLLKWVGRGVLGHSWGGENVDSILVGAAANVFRACLAGHPGQLRLQLSQLSAAPGFHHGADRNHGEKTGSPLGLPPEMVACRVSTCILGYIG